MLDQEYDEPYEELFERIEPEAVRGGVDRTGAPRHAARRARGRGQDPVPGHRRGDPGRPLERRHDPAPRRRRLRPGLDAKAVADELRERVLEELDYEHEAQNQRSFARAYRGHPFIHVPDVVTRLSRDKVLVTEFVSGSGLRGGEAAGPGGAQPLRRDRLPLLPRLDLPAQPLQRRRAPRQLRAARRRTGRVPRLRDDEAPRPRADPARGGGREGASRPATPSGCARSCTSSASCATRSASTRSS